MNDILKNKWEEVYERENLPWLKNPIPVDVLSEFIKHIHKDAEVLDYGGGNGILSRVLIEAGLDVTCSDISEKALELAKREIPQLKTVQTTTPEFFYNQEKYFDAILVWGVMHHVDKKEWNSFLQLFFKILKNEGIILIGGHSSKDEDFSEGFRISPTTGHVSYAVNDLGDMAKEIGFTILDTNFFEFNEAFSGEKRVFKYFLLKK